MSDSQASEVKLENHKHSDFETATKKDQRTCRRGNSSLVYRGHLCKLDSVLCQAKTIVVEILTIAGTHAAITDLCSRLRTLACEFKCRLEVCAVHAIHSRD